MALGTTLEELIKMVRAEAGLSSNASQGIDHREMIVQKINRVYQSVYEAIDDWPNLRTDATKELQAGQRYYDIPEINPHRVERCWVKYAETWQKVEQGIDPTLYMEIDSDEDERDEPVMFWQPYGEKQFEVWPVPTTNDQLMRFRGMSPPRTFVADADRCDLDDFVIAMMVASELLAKSNQKDAQIMAERGARRLADLKARYATQRRVQVGVPTDYPIRRYPRIRVAYVRNP